MYYKKTFILLVILLGLMLTVTAKAKTTRTIDWEKYNNKVYTLAKTHYSNWGYLYFVPLPEIDWSYDGDWREKLNNLDHSKNYLKTEIDIGAIRIKDLRGNITTCDEGIAYISRTRYADWDMFEWFPNKDFVRQNLHLNCKTVLKNPVKLSTSYYTYSSSSDSRVSKLEKKVKKLEKRVSVLENQ